MSMRHHIRPVEMLIVGAVDPGWHHNCLIRSLPPHMQMAPPRVFLPHGHPEEARLRSGKALGWMRNTSPASVSAVGHRRPASTAPPRGAAPCLHSLPFPASDPAAISGPSDPLGEVQRGKTNGSGVTGPARGCDAEFPRPNRSARLAMDPDGDHRASFSEP